MESDALMADFESRAMALVIVIAVINMGIIAVNNYPGSGIHIMAQDTNTSAEYQGISPDLYDLNISGSLLGTRPTTSTGEACPTWFPCQDSSIGWVGDTLNTAITFIGLVGNVIILIFRFFILLLIGVPLLLDWLALLLGGGATTPIRFIFGAVSVPVFVITIYGVLLMLLRIREAARL